MQVGPNVVKYALVVVSSFDLLNLRRRSQILYEIIKTTSSVAILYAYHPFSDFFGRDTIRYLRKVI